MIDAKFLHLANHRHENLFDAPIMIGGFYNWHRAMEGDFGLYMSKKGNLKNYDILFMGLSKPELDGYVASQVRKEIGWGKTKLVICIDYAVELWQSTFNPHALKHELENADIIFVSEPSAVSHMNAIMDGKKPVHHLVYPSQIELISKFEKPKELRSEEIIALVHRYDNNWLSPYLATKNLPWNTHALLLDGELEKTLYAFFKYMRSGFEFTEYLDWMSRKKVLVDSYHKLHTYGRSPVDCACVGVPCVGTTWTYAQTLLWPNLTVEPGDIYGQQKLIEKLMTNDEFYDDCVAKAKEVLPMFSYKERKKEFIKLVYGGE